MARVRLKTLSDWSSDGDGALAGSAAIAAMPFTAAVGATSETVAPPGVLTNGAMALSWSDPSRITIATATHTIGGQAIAFSNILPSEAVTLLSAAERAWEAVANVQFVPVDDSGSDSVSAADIRVGLGNLSPMGFIGYTGYSWDTGSHFQANTIVALADVGQSAVTVLGNGNVQFNGSAATVFQDLLHELGHALGLAHNPYSAASIMNPILDSANPYITAQDATALRALYGAPTAAAVAAAQADPTLAKLLPWPGAVTV